MRGAGGVEVAGGTGVHLGEGTGVHQGVVEGTGGHQEVVGVMEVDMEGVEGDTEDRDLTCGIRQALRVLLCCGLLS